MPRLTPKEKFTIGAYVALLTIAILIIWGFFLKYELKVDKSQESGDTTWRSIKASLADLRLASEAGLEVFKKNVSLNAGDSQPASTLAESFASLAQLELAKKRTLDWQRGSDDSVDFKYPADWTVGPSTNHLVFDIGSTVDLAATMTLSFLENTAGLTAREWWQSSGIEGLTALPLENLWLDGQPAVKIVLSDRDLVYSPAGGQMLEISISYLKKTEELSQQLNDFMLILNFLSE